MGETTGISWTDSTWSPLRGCSVASPGCQNCYAAGIAARFSGAGLPFEGFAKRSEKRGLPQWTGKVELRPEHLADPLRWRKGRRIFVSSMSDVFHEELSNEDIAAIFGVMAAASQHTFQVLTKRAERMKAWFDWFQGELAGEADVENDRSNECLARLLASFAQSELGDGSSADEDRQFWRINDSILKAGPTWPLPNVWLGVSVEDQKRADERIPFLLETPAAVRFISAEPLLEGIDITEYLDPAGAACGETNDETLDWIIAGFESGPRARPGHVAWIRNILVGCEEAGVPAFVKQLGARPHDWTEAGSVEDVHVNRPPFDDARLVRPLELRDRAGADPSEWEESLRVQQFPGGAS